MFTVYGLESFSLIEIEVLDSPAVICSIFLAYCPV